MNYKKCCENYNGDVDITHSCIFCKTYLGRFREIDGYLVLHIPMKQSGEFTYGEGEYEVDNLCGLKWGDEYSIASMNYLDYKDDFQVGMPLIILEDKEEWEEVCGKFHLTQFYYDKCAECGDILSGCFTINNKGQNICLDHEE